MSPRPLPPQPLGTSHDLTAFGCGGASLDDWLKGRARDFYEHYGFQALPLDPLTQMLRLGTLKACRQSREAWRDQPRFVRTS